jgi:hypothetical protein
MKNVDKTRIAHQKRQPLSEERIVCSADLNNGFQDFSLNQSSEENKKQ